LVSPTFSPRYQEFLVRLRQARLAAGMTQVDVAKALDKPQSYVSKCETGERRVDVTELQLFAAIYQRSIEDFLPKL
jgi:transcriptional regulator with XRE-family HTH domain